MKTKREMILIGGGHAHVQVLKAFGDDPPTDCNITVVVDDPVAMYSGMAPGFVAGQYAREDLEIDVRPLAHRAGARVIIARCERVDPEERLLTIADQEPVSYDVASFNIGSTVLGLAVPGVRDFAMSTRPLSGLVAEIPGLIELARMHEDAEPFHVVVVGGGVGGIELAFTIQARLADETGGSISVTLLDAGAQILSRYPESLRRRVHRVGSARSVIMRTGAHVARLEENCVVLDDDERIASNAVIWVTGPASHSLFTDSPGIRTDANGFARIRSTLQLDGYDNLFAVGDCGTFIDYPSTPKAGVYAVREGPYITHNLKAFISGGTLRGYTPQGDFLTLLNLGHGYAVGTKRSITFGGKWVMRWKDHIDRKFMAIFQLPWPM